MSDSELVELAAQAVGLAGVYDADFEMLMLFDSAVVPTMWNPLKSDADALQLAADLRLLIKPGKHLGDGCTVEAQSPGIAGCTCFRDDKREQMRRAIVHVAAEIGKAKP